MTIFSQNPTGVVWPEFDFIISKKEESGSTGNGFFDISIGKNAPWENNDGFPAESRARTAT